MDTRFTILIAERNPRVRQLLGREFAADGFLVIPAENGTDLSGIIGREDTPDLLVLDDELPGLDPSRLAEQLGNRLPPLPFVVHSFSTECVDSGLVEAAADVVEKTGNIEKLRETVKRVLQTEYHGRFDSLQGRAADEEASNFGNPLGTMGTHER
jgi:DNA-binding response OmpR family regulator